ncbi:hypothetical protein ACWGJP_03515 [Microbacterium sp. NPDC055903]
MHAHARTRSSRPLIALAVVGALITGTVAWNAGIGQARGDAPEPGGYAWPATGAAAIAVNGGPASASSDRAYPMASISKVVTSLMILEERPLSVGEEGERYRMTETHERAYLESVQRGESALEVPVGGDLSQYQLLEGILIGSACNYADILVERIWGDDDAFADAVASFLARQGLTGITMVEPTGIDPRNTATPAALVDLGRLALADPVVAEIVAKRSVVLPGAGRVENTNELLAEPGSLGIKTGTVDGNYNLLSARDIIAADGATLRVIVVVLGQPDDETRFEASRALSSQIEQTVPVGAP